MIGILHRYDDSLHAYLDNISGDCNLGMEDNHAVQYMGSYESGKCEIYPLRRL